MKRTLFLTLALAVCMFNAEAAITVSGADNTYVYNGNDYIAVNSSATSTTTTVTFNLAKAVEYVSSDAYDSSSYLLGWNSNVGSSYGLTVMSDGSGGVQITAAIFGEVWNDTQGRNKTISYETLNAIKDSSGNVTLTIQNTKDAGVTASYGEASTTWSGLQYSSYATTYGYRTNDAYVTSVTLQTDGTQLDTPYVSPYESQRTDNSSVGRILFAGDSITHGINEATWRWQLFKTLTDNGIENEIMGPRSQFESKFPNSATRDAMGNLTEYSYGGTTYENDHLAQASGRVRDILAGVQVQSGAGATYGGGQNSAANTTAVYNYDTVICLMGTNDLLSDTGYTSDNFKNKISALLGGSVEYDSETRAYNWTCTETGSWGNMGKLVADLLPDKNDDLYLLNIPVFSIHTNVDQNDGTDGYSEIRNAVSQYNEHYKIWVSSYNQAHGTSVKLIDINRGLLDVTRGEFYGHEQFFRLPDGGDGIHPSEQGSLIIAGNIAQGMGIGGRTAGLVRADAATSGTEWTGLPVGADGKISAGDSLTIAENVFTINDGYTVDFKAVFGNGAEGEWLSAADASMSIAVGDGAHSGTLRLSEGYIMWGDSVLFCWDNSKLSEEGNLRIAWHNGNAADNVMDGYYVWLGDMLIGQGLEASDGSFNGITLSATGAAGYITELIYSNKAYAPTTTLTTSVDHAYTDGQAPVIHKAEPVLSGVDFSSASSKEYSANGIVSMNFSGDTTYKHTTGAPVWIGLTRADDDRSFNYQETGKLGTIFGSMVHSANNTTYVGNGNKLLIEVVENADVTGSEHGEIGIGIAGTFGAASADEFHVYINGGVVGSSSTSDALIIGGAVHGAGNIGKVNIVVNDGYVRDSIYGGSYGSSASGATVGSATITINGGRIDGDIVARGTHGTIGNTDIVINGGYIGGNISKGTATAKTGAVSTVTVVGNKADIRGNIEADKVTLKNVSKLALYDNGFDNYRGTITAPVVVLDNVKNKILATLSELESLTAINGTETELTMGETLALDALELGADTSLGLFKSADDHTVSTATETTLTISGVLTVSGSGATLNANLVMGAGSELKLAGNSLQLGSSLTLGGVQLDDITIDKVTALDAGVALTLFTEVDELILDGVSYTEATDAAASTAFANTELAEGYRLVYSGADAGGAVSIMAVPEPATTTLSLLALAALAARRRRK